MIETLCHWCFRSIQVYPSTLRKQNYCCQQCVLEARAEAKRTKNSLWFDTSAVSKHMTALNQQLNPTRMTPEVREKVRNARLNTGSGKSYPKLYGRHEHRAVAERVLGRSLAKGEVVHHLDGNKRNNDPGNLLVFASQAEHARWHKQQEEVMPT